MTLARFQQALHKAGFTGDITTETADRLLSATDNSIYQVLPSCVLYPRSETDIMHILACAPSFPDLHFTPRGGGTGTDGQSLNKSIIVDCSKYMRKILEINIEEKWARVQPGAILDELQDAIRPLGYYFPVNISTSNRATFGGMFATDAAGEGSFINGRTADHVIEANIILPDGSLFVASKKRRNELDHEAEKTIARIIDQNCEAIQDGFPNIPRYATGYNLAKCYHEDKFHFPYLFGGSEGTLGITSELTLRLMPTPKHKKLIAVIYPNFETALAEAAKIHDAGPFSIEVMDETVTTLIQEDFLYEKIKHIVPKKQHALTLIEARAHTLDEMNKQLDKLKLILKHPFHVISQEEAAATLWQCRKNSVGLLGRSNDYKRPIPFVEDATVHPHDLSAYINDFRAILDKHNIRYGMFGHADSGCIHVRPALNLMEEKDVALLKKISSDIFTLTREYDGIFWGEHGLGFRSQYNPEFFGEKLYRAMRQVKSAFDPRNQLNPGKIAAPLDGKNHLYHIDGPLRAQQDIKIPGELQVRYKQSLICNGNALCFNYQTHSVMCPSYKATNNRMHSPKGRASLLREWLSHNPNLKKRPFLIRLFNSIFRKTFANTVHGAMTGCLGCKACNTTCPIQVSIPYLKSQFLNDYYKSHTRPLKDWLIMRSEKLAKWQSALPGLSNTMNQIAAPICGLTQLPKYCKKNLDLNEVNLKTLERLEGDKHVLLWQDAFTRFYEPHIVIALQSLVGRLGYTFHALPFLPSGKPFHVKGDLSQFEKIQNKNTHFLNTVSQHGHPIITIDPSIGLTYRDEYTSMKAKVLLLQEWLDTTTAISRADYTQRRFTLLPHCTEATADARYLILWKTVFKKFGLDLEIPPIGCCGMAGSFGLEKCHFETSKRIYQQNWRGNIKNASKTTLLATGFSCRSQTARFSSQSLRHPIEVL